ncbi:MAG TPA: hypothetical protein VF894_12315 [Anaeromyxobacter sp.]
MKRPPSAESSRTAGKIRRRVLAALATASAVLGPPAGRAACPGDPPALAAAPTDARLAFLRQHLDAARPGAHRWTLGWGLTEGALSAGQLVAIPFTPDRSSRIVLAAGVAAGALGLAQIAFLPVTVPPLPPAGSAGDACATLANLERILEHGARNQALGTGAAAHVGNFVVNAGLGIGTALAARRRASGALAFGIGWAIGEAQILTQPTALVRDRERYRAGELGSVSPPPVARLAVHLGGAAVSVEVRF